jgi:outer membrane murein-binding lipoprotein Lpp
VLTRLGCVLTRLRCVLTRPRCVLNPTQVCVNPTRVCVNPTQELATSRRQCGELEAAVAALERKVDTGAAAQAMAEGEARAQVRRVTRLGLEITRLSSRVPGNTSWCW